MTSQPFPGAAARGAVDLSGLSTTSGGAPRTPAGQGEAPAQPAGGSRVVVEATDATIQQIMQQSVKHPVVLLVWSGRQGGAETVSDFAAVAEASGGRFLLATVDVDASPGLAQALGVQQIPMAVGLLQGQPVPLFVGPQPREVIQRYVDELAKVAVANGVTGRVEGADAAPELPPLSPEHEEAYAALDRGDFDAARAAYDKALAKDPKDRDAAIGKAQVDLLQRTTGVDLLAARAAAAADPSDVDAQLLVADLDVMGGHVEDAFLRLVDLVRTLAGDDRERVRLHLVQLFDVVGAEDPRVKKGRTALMSALF
ncbi:tetratricopeptide repeat protein [Arsenicicoccus dermatophilus]|uniref:tetratricopeptide repeat protein n=1 Tax=Arsenicicoccus dermatophilus TaxID=1076331 RepID=UPI001F4CEDB9|nr:tetratricopeptide repeat protein [Arsenicicoccus dermatophilus]MCH8612390.1 tetratricopeptide repeat protein [Arsenicicoccus dermatophilus]